MTNLEYERKLSKHNRFCNYLKLKLNQALSNNMKNVNYNWDIDTQFGIGIYLINTPVNFGPVKEWATFCGGSNSEMSLCNYDITEPSFYFGSGTKPLTATLVVCEIYKLWRTMYPNISCQHFLNWYANSNNIPGSPPSITFKDLFYITRGFPFSQFTEKLSYPLNNIENKSIVQTLQQWLYCCPKGGLIASCPSGTSLFCDNTCDNLCSKIELKDSNSTCKKPYCPSSICTWSWKNEDGSPAKVDPDGFPFFEIESCKCPVIKPTQFQEIFQNLSIYDITMMRSGIPDSDSIWGIDTFDQISFRTLQIGPVQFVGEILGFDWDGRWRKNKNGDYVPMTVGSSYLLPTNHPAASYSSSAYTFLGILLWLFSDSQGLKDWSEIDLNVLLPRCLYDKINFAGTSGNYGCKYFNIDNHGNRYYSFGKTVYYGNVIQPNITPNSPITWSDKGIFNKNYIPVTYKVKLRSGEVSFIDWDSSSGVACGNAWGTCSNMAEIYMNMCSKNALNPILPREIQCHYIDEFINYNGINAEKLYNNQIRSPLCSGANAWSQNFSYNCGFMGPDWFYIFNNVNYGLIPCFGHLGSTYGFCSSHIYFPGGIIKPFVPFKDNKQAYLNSDWSMKFDFSGGFEFTISTALNSNLSQSTELIQEFINLVIEDPFEWN